MSILDGSTSPQAQAAGSGPPSDRLRVITAGSVGNMEARLGTSGFDVVAAAETEDALIDAVSVDEPDAIVVEADLCDSLEHVRDLAPDAVLIAVGDHTPAGALGRVERGMSGTAMAGLLHALVAEGVGAAVVWGLVPTFRAGALRVPQSVGLSMLSAKADLIRAHLANALRDPAQLVTAAGTVALTVSASLLVTFSAPRTNERPERDPISAPAMEPAPPHPVVFATSTTPSAGYGPSWDEGEPGNQPGPNSGDSSDHGRQDHPPSDAWRPPGAAYGWDHRPPKHADNGHHKGLNSNSVPEDLPPGSNSVPKDPPPGSNSVPKDPPPGSNSVPEDPPPGSANKAGRGQASGPPCLPASPPCTQGK
jgi:hypothetical protein